MKKFNLSLTTWFGLISYWYFDETRKKFKNNKSFNLISNVLFYLHSLAIDTLRANETIAIRIESVNNVVNRWKRGKAGTGIL